MNEEAMKAILELGELVDESMNEFRKEANDWWEKLPYDDRLKAFHSIVSKIREGELEDQGSYRYILYDVFGFKQDAYMVGMDCGYMDIHNMIVTREEMKKILADEREQAIEDYILQEEKNKNLPQGAD